MDENSMEILSGHLSRLTIYTQWMNFRWVGVLFFFFVIGITVTSCRSPFASPTPQCVEPTLKVDATSFHIETITPAPDGSLTVPQDTPNIAYWFDGTDVNYVFGLSALASNTSLLESLQSGETATITWANCNSTTYVLSAPEAGITDSDTLLDQSVSQITIFIQSDTPEGGLIMRGSLTEEQISTFNTPDTTAVQAEISLLETTAAPDNSTIRVGLSILNQGNSTLEMTVEDISLITSSGIQLNLILAEPVLPKEINPGATESFYFIFPWPNTPTATLRILGVEYDFEGY